MLPPSTPIFSDSIVLQNNNCVAIVFLSLAHSLAIIVPNVLHIFSHNKLTKLLFLKKKPGLPPEPPRGYWPPERALAAVRSRQGRILVLAFAGRILAIRPVGRILPHLRRVPGAAGGPQGDEGAAHGRNEGAQVRNPTTIFLFFRGKSLTFPKSGPASSSPRIA